MSVKRSTSSSNELKHLYDKEFIKQFTLAALRAVEKQKFNIKRPKLIIDADLIPELSHQLMNEYALHEELLNKLRQLNESGLDQVPLEKSTEELTVSPATITPQKDRPKPAPRAPQLEITEGNGYEKIVPLLEDGGISRIQCLGPNKPLVLIKMGQKQSSKVILNPDQIHDVFQEIAEQAHIPLIEGPIQLALPEYSLEGINARVTDSKFVIQKNTAYSMLEQNSAASSGMPQRRLPPRRPMSRPRMPPRR